MTAHIIDGMPNAEYHASPAISKSGLDLIDQSPAHYYAACLDPKREPRRETPALTFGTAVHAAILEPDLFASRYIASPKFDRRTKAGKAAAEEFEAANAGKLVLSADDFAGCLKVRDSVRANGAVSSLLENGAAETSVFSRMLTDAGEVDVRVRPDWRADDWSVLVDIKTTEDARPSAFARAIAGYRYDVQAAFYTDVAMQAVGDAPRLFVFIAVEKSPPYAVACYYADETLFTRGRVLYRRNLETYAHCLRDGFWPAYPEELLPISLPAWAMRADS